MTDISKRLRASLRYDVMNGEQWEREVFFKQIVEAADALDLQTEELAAAKRIIEAEYYCVSVKSIQGNETPSCSPEHDRTRWSSCSPCSGE